MTYKQIETFHRDDAIVWRWIGDDVRFCKRSGMTSPPYPDLHARLGHGDLLPESIFPVF
ncbi:MAG: hypothetical protein GY894_00590 [Planctomycetes bacterium]|nr:hypothetical protein [Planctomycetota bacterium]MCP4837846.1 hypothetical protein [Planctomycetota bacterium]